LKSAHYRDPATREGAEMMYVNGELVSSNDQQADAGLNMVQDFLDHHGTALANAAYQLGGAEASGMVFRLIGEIREARKLTSGHFSRLRKLHALLFLQNVGEPDREETGLFVNIIPGSRLVDEICLLADALDDLLINVTEQDDVINVHYAPDLLDAA
jgi:hypothetical protein